MPVQISVTSDFICPWCYIGEKRLARAIERLPSGIEVQLQWLPFELNPDMPPGGMDRTTYLSRKFGSAERVEAIQARTVLAGQDDGATFDYEAIKRTPNTFLAHRVSWLAQREGKQRALVEAALQAYFIHGRDIGSPGVLADIAAGVGFDRSAIAAFLRSEDGVESVRALERMALDRGIQGVPYFDIGGTAIVGAQPAETILQTIMAAAGRLARRAPPLEVANMKVGVIGAGAVGSASLLSMVMRGIACEIVVVDRNRQRAQGVVTDLQYGATLSPAVVLEAGDYPDLTDAVLVIITAGINEKAGGAIDRSDPAGRLKLLKANAEIYRDIVPNIVAVAPRALILVVTDPPDPLAALTRRLAGHGQVVSSGTFLDTLRFRFHLARRLKVNPRSVAAQVVGEHGTSQVFLWSSARVGGMPVTAALGAGSENVEEFRRHVEDEVRYANISIIEGTGASQLGIGMATARIVEALLRDEHAVLPVGSFNPTYGTTLSLPSVLGRTGVIRVLEPEMSENERQALQLSATRLREAEARLEV